MMMTNLHCNQRVSLLLNLFYGEHFQSTRILIKHWGKLYNKQIKKTTKRESEKQIRAQQSKYKFWQNGYGQQIKGFLPIEYAVSLNAICFKSQSWCWWIFHPSLHNTSIPHGLHLPGFNLLSSFLSRSLSSVGTSSLVTNKNRDQIAKCHFLDKIGVNNRRTCPGT